MKKAIIAIFVIASLFTNVNAQTTTPQTVNTVVENGQTYIVGKDGKRYTLTAADAPSQPSTGSGSAQNAQQVFEANELALESRRLSNQNMKAQTNSINVHTGLDVVATLVNAGTAINGASNNTKLTNFIIGGGGNSQQRSSNNSGRGRGGNGCGQTTRRTNSCGNEVRRESTTCGNRRRQNADPYVTSTCSQQQTAQSNCGNRRRQNVDPYTGQ